MVAISRPQPNRGGGNKPLHFLATILLCVISYYTGTLQSSSSSSSSTTSVTSTQTAAVVTKEACAKLKTQMIFEEAIKEEDKIEEIVQQRVHEVLMAHKEHQEDMEHEQKERNDEIQKKSASAENEVQQPAVLFTKSHSSIMNGIARTKKDEYVKQFDYGSPMDIGQGTSGEDVLVLYNSPKALPTSSEEINLAVQYGTDNHTKDKDGGMIPLLSPEEATENCDLLQVVTVSKNNDKQCTVLVNNYENYHIQKWMRVAEDRKGKVNPDEPLRTVSRGKTTNGISEFVPPDKNSISKHWKTLYTYLDTLEDVLSRLKPIAEKVAVKNTIIVMTCNMGQSELLMNFVCNAKAKGLDVDNVLVFPTDIETKELAEGLGLATFYDEKNFEKIPSGEAKGYGDKNFVAMMFAKVVCVQLINHLGYDLLFQDVDIVWYKNPIEYFHDSNNQHYDFDMYFQDDGAHTKRYAPYSANSGFYYVRNNDKTRYLFDALLYSGDMILQSHSHQQALVQLMAEHASLFGLKVKVFSRDTEELPGGYQYHKRNKVFMMKVLKKEVTPIIFHMSWTKNKDNKIKFFQQMGQWHVQDVCIAQTKSAILEHKEEDGNQIGDVNENGDEIPVTLFEPCCLAKPNIVCHYRDKPSIIPCKDSDPIDKGRPSFW